LHGKDLFPSHDPHGSGSWLNTHCSIDALGKRHLHTCVDGKFFL